MHGLIQLRDCKFQNWQMIEIQNLYLIFRNVKKHFSFVTSLVETLQVIEICPCRRPIWPAWPIYHTQVISWLLMTLHHKRQE